MSDIDDLFDYDAGLDDVLKNIPSAPNKETSQTETNADATKVLGLDEDIKPTKQRAPIAKLDEARGIPKLRKDVRTKLKFKGKGHELCCQFSDLGRLLNFYQLWLDDLYPRAKFADGLAMIEKLGHTKRVQIMRREWINEEKPDYRRHDRDHDNNNHDNSTFTSKRNGAPADTITTSNDATNNDPLGDELEDLFAERPRRGSAPKQNASNGPSDDTPPDDDLDMLLAEAENITSTPKNNTYNEPSTGDAPPDDDLDMLLAEAENTTSAIKQTSSNEATINSPAIETNDDNDAPPDDDLEMLLAEAENIAQAGNGGRESIFNRK
uniref:Chromosome segregation in meiosis protein n=1 Tax=Talaromyces marneffei PM1 TaxID=1077442 RepID=A0A093UWA0_TALMA